MSNLDAEISRLYCAMFWNSTAVAERLPVVRVYEPNELALLADTGTGLELIDVPGLQYDTDFSFL